MLLNEYMYAVWYVYATGTIREYCRFTLQNKLADLCQVDLDSLDMLCNSLNSRDNIKVKKNGLLLQHTTGTCYLVTDAKGNDGSGTRTHASEKTSALN